jgi:hypothetical protein
MLNGYKKINNKVMPTGYVRKIAKKHHVSVDTAESEWNAAKKIGKKQYGEDGKKLWGTVTNIFKNKMNAHHGKGKRKKKNENVCTSFIDFMNERMDNIDDIDYKEVANYVRGEESKMKFYIEYGINDGQIKYDTTEAENISDAVDYAHEKAREFYKELEKTDDDYKSLDDIMKDLSDDYSGKELYDEAEEQYSDIVEDMIHYHAEPYTADAHDEFLYGHSIEEKWKTEKKIKSTGEHSKKSIDELEKELNDLKGKKPYDRKKAGELSFAIRAKRHWKGGVK